MTNPIIVATDGSALNNPNGPAGWAWFVDKANWNYGSFPKASNQAAELAAIYKALQALPKHIPLVILTDSKFWISTLGDDGKTGWRAEWKRNNWIKKDGKIPANLTLLKQVDALILNRTASLKLVWVKGHAGNEMNTIVDKLCTKASAAERDKVKLPKAPGWTGRLAPLDGSKPKETKPAVPKRTAPAKPKRSAPMTRLHRSAPRRDIITSFDDYADDNLEVITKKVEDKKTYCESCEAPIDIFTGACRCFKS